MSRQKKFDALVEDVDEDYGDEEYDEQPEEEVITKEVIEDRYKAIRKLVPGDITRKEIIQCLEKNNYDVDKTTDEVKKIVLSREKAKEAKKVSEAKKVIQAKKEKPPLEEVKVKPISPKPVAPKDLNQIYPKVEYKCIDPTVNNNDINLVVIGHVDAGKSTIMGHLLYKLGYVTHGKMTQYEKESKLQGKSSFQFAWVLDENVTEREHGVTINIAMKHFQLKDKHFTLIDAPGHKDFVPNMISGAAQADCAMLVIDSKKGAFEAGFMRGGQTKEHAILARCLGVTQLLVAINKLDKVLFVIKITKQHEWDQTVYDNIVATLEPFLLSVGYKKDNIRYVPVSGLLGENLTTKTTNPKLASWYTGPPLSELIYTFKPVKRGLDKPIRACISDSYVSSAETMKGTCVSAKIEGGAIETGNNLVLMPLNVPCTVKTIIIGENKTNVTKAGDTAEISIHTTEKLDPASIKSGMVLSSIEYPINPITKFKTQIITFELQTPITLGYHIVVHCYSLKVPAKFAKIEKAISEGVEKKFPKRLMSNQTAFVVIETFERVCLELYQNYKGLGRIAIRDSTGTLATGIVIELISQQ
eukprot:TRINITY_DN627_c0_g1_i1.p4 TRINITY_DN627_c0_g1~~TRINITY_DN627_c0_g1_i1.p4  ORF type:complete len:585 (-),score=90.41 TRINITY_DN627_c0_g1_i1:23729-25483(-)